MSETPLLLDGDPNSPLGGALPPGTRLVDRDPFWRLVQTPAAPEASVGGQDLAGKQHVGHASILETGVERIRRVTGHDAPGGQVIERWPEVQGLITRAVAHRLHAGG